MTELLIVLAVFAGLALAGWSFTTRAWWMPGSALGVFGMWTLTSLPSTHDDVGGIGALAAGVGLIAGLGLLVLAAIGFAIGSAVRSKVLRSRAPAPAPEPPEARTVTGR